MLALLTGLAAGFLHVLSGPDHLAAVAPLAVRGHRRAWVAGLRWGLGHSAGVALVGLLALGLREVFPIEAVSAWSERLVGVLLIGIGLWSVRKALQVQIHAHEHAHDGSAHQHVHFHVPDHGHEHDAAPHVHTHAAFGIGTLHGLAGSSHFLGVLPSLALPTTAQRISYLLAFAVGTVAAMAGFSSVLGLLSARWGGNNYRQAYRGLLFACAAAAFAVGGWWIVTA
jgi:ABC-type nickel/cobalt efflux system permease component RcnA